MSYQIVFTDEADKGLAMYKKSNPLAYKKLLTLIPELEKHPRTGTGHPKPLVAGDSVTYSRRISKKDRVVYDVCDDIITVIILSVEGHYNDK